MYEFPRQVLNLVRQLIVSALYDIDRILFLTTNLFNIILTSTIYVRTTPIKIRRKSMTSLRHIYAVMGASGHIGSVVAKLLLSAGNQVRVIGRSIEHLKRLVDQGAIPHTGDFYDVEMLKKAFIDVDGVFTMIPPNYQAPDHLAFQDQVGSAIASAIHNSQVKYLVNLSSIGAHLTEKNGPIQGLHK